LNINSITNGCGWETRHPDDTLTAVLIGNCGIFGLSGISGGLRIILWATLKNLFCLSG
jgi:hypothetical protein